MSTHKKINSLKKKKKRWHQQEGESNGCHRKPLFRCWGCHVIPVSTFQVSLCGQLQNELHFPLKYDFITTVVFTGKVCKEIATFCLRTRIYFQF